jgi:hypothetical protein
MRDGFLGLLLAILGSIALAYGAGTAVIAETAPPAITVRVRDTAGVPEDVLAEAREDVTQIFRQAGVTISWTTPESMCAASNAARQAALTVAILSSEQAARMDSGVTDDRVGFAAPSTAGSGQVAYVFYDRIDVLAEVNGWHQARILAIAMAHEVGHLLLPYDVHSVDGVMRADWTNADMQLAQRNLLFFTQEEGNLLLAISSSELVTTI